MIQRHASQPVWKRTALLILTLALVAVSVLPAVGPTPARSQEESQTPVLAYYYIWFDPSSWNRAKIDYPVLGRYSSDEREVMRQHIRWAKDAGIDGFIVSWKSTEILNRRLEKLMEVARAEGFKLSMIYQGLDFERDPLTIDRVAADLDLFTERYADDEVFDMFAKPVMIWSGTWQFSREEIAQTVESRRDRLLILATEKDLEGYQRLAGLVDGDAYYWSSVDPQTHQGYPDKLVAMAKEIHAGGGLWIVPAAPGFDARLLGGERVVSRRAGETLRLEMDAAASASPDAIGIISWNEFSENTHIEPSQTYGTESLSVVAEMLGGSAPAAVGVDSSDPSTTGAGFALPLIGGILALGAAGMAVIFWRSRHLSGDLPTPPREEQHEAH